MDKMGQIRGRQNGKDIEVKCPPQAVILPARAFCFEIEAILTPRWCI
jgi:hypothetical protein